jgi:hypothetical protein
VPGSFAVTQESDVLTVLLHAVHVTMLGARQITPGEGEMQHEQPRENAKRAFHVVHVGRQLGRARNTMSGDVAATSGH